MQVFVVFYLSKPEVVAGAVRARFPNDHLQLEDGVWLVAGEGLTTRDVGDGIGVSDGTNGNAIIVSVDAYWGRAPSNVWEWISQKRAVPHGG